MSEQKLWLWKNFVNGRPEYWAFDTPFPCYADGDPMVIGEPCGYALFKHAPRIGGHGETDAQIIAAIRRAKETP